MQTKQKQEMNTNQTTDKQKQREVNTAAAVQSRGLSSLRIDLKVCQTGPKKMFLHFYYSIHSNVSVQHKYAGFGLGMQN
jgi:hypothetical protein